MRTQSFEVAIKLMTAVMEGFGLMGLDDQDFEGLFKAIKEHSDHRMPIGRIQFEDASLDDGDRLRLSFALSPVILSSAEGTYTGINRVKWFIVLPDLDVDFSEMTVPKLLAKSQLGLINTSNYDLDELAHFLDKERLPFFN